MVRVVVIDDHAIVVEGLRALFAREPDIALVGEAADARSALERVEAERPDVVLLDVSLPGTNGIAVARELLRRRPTERIVLLSMYTAEDYVTEGLSVGALGYVGKDQTPHDIVDAVRLAARGESYLSPRLSGSVASDASRQRRTGDDGSGGPLERLSPREREVLDLMLRGLTNEGIASELFISRRTVETHRAHILKKLHVHSLPELFRFASRRGLLRE